MLWLALPPPTLVGAATFAAEAAGATGSAGAFSCAVIGAGADGLALFTAPKIVPPPPPAKNPLEAGAVSVRAAAVAPPLIVLAGAAPAAAAAGGAFPKPKVVGAGAAPAAGGSALPKPPKVIGAALPVEGAPPRAIGAALPVEGAPKAIEVVGAPVLAGAPKLNFGASPFPNLGGLKPELSAAPPNEAPDPAAADALPFTFPFFLISPAFVFGFGGIRHAGFSPSSLPCLL